MPTAVAEHRQISITGIFRCLLCQLHRQVVSFEVFRRNILLLHVAEHRRYVAPFHPAVAYRSFHMVGIRIPVHLRQAELSPKVVYVAVVVDAFVFPPVVVPERFEGMRLPIHQQHVPGVRTVAVSPSRHKVNGYRHPHGRQ